MILDPRFFRLDDLLRRPLCPTLAWGLPERGFSLVLTADGEPVVPADGHWRPSHQTLYGQEEFSGLQVVQDAFVASDGTHVAQLTLRNPSADTVAIELAVAWGQHEGAGESGWVHRCAPALDERFFQLPAGMTTQRTVTLALASDEDTAWRNATRWYFEASPAATQAQRLDDWRADNAPLFDCADPWLTRLVAHSQAERWRGATLPLPPGGLTPHQCFPNGDFDALPEPTYAWDRVVMEQLAAAQVHEETLLLSPYNFLNLPSFCLQGFYGTTIVWDDPMHPDDAYQDGDKGLTIYHGRRRIYNQPTLAPCSVTLAREPGSPRAQAHF